MAHSVSAGGGGSSVSAGASGGGGGTAKAPASLKVNSAALERFVAANSAKFLAEANTPESSALVAAGSAGPLAHRDTKRILHIAFQREWGVAYLQFMQTTRPCGHEMFDCVFPFKHHLYSYVSASVFQDYDGTLDGDLRNDLVKPVLVGKLTNGREWHELDLFAPLEARLRKERGRAPRAGEDTSAFFATTLFSSRCNTMATLCLVDRLQTAQFDWVP